MSSKLTHRLNKLLNNLLPPLNVGKKRTRNFTAQENNMLVTAWLQISLDLVQGTDQTRSTYWKGIHDYYHEHKTFESERNISSLSHRWGIIRKSVNRFCGWLTQVQNRKESRLIEQDRIERAKELYQAKDLDGKSFALMHCWNKLHNEQHNVGIGSGKGVAYMYI